MFWRYHQWTAPEGKISRLELYDPQSTTCIYLDAILLERLSQHQKIGFVRDRNESALDLHEICQSGKLPTQEAADHRDALTPQAKPRLLPSTMPW